MDGSLIGAFLASPDGWERADIVRRAFDQLWVSGKTEEMIESLPPNPQSRSTTKGRADAAVRLARSLSNPVPGSDAPGALSDGVAGHLLLRAATDCALHGDLHTAERLLDEASDRFAEWFDPRNPVVNSMGLVATAVARATVYRTAAPADGQRPYLRQALEDLTVSPEVVTNSGSRELAIELELQATAVRIGLRLPAVAPVVSMSSSRSNRRAEDGLSLVSKALWELTAARDAHAGELLRDAGAVLRLHVASQPRFRGAAAATTLAELFLAVEQADSERVGTIASDLLDQLLGLRDGIIAGPLANQIPWVTNEILVATERVRLTRECAHAAIRAAVEVRQAALESLLVQPLEARNKLRTDLTRLVDRLRRANDRATIMRGVPPEPLRDVRVEIAREMPLFASLASTTPLDVGELRSVLGASWLLVVAEVSTIGGEARWHAVSVGPQTATDIAAVALEPTDLDRIAEVDYERSSDELWHAWWASIAERVLTPALHRALTDAATNDPTRLTVVASGVAGALPFAALRLADGRRLIEAAILGVLPSARLLTAESRSWSASPTVAASWALTGAAVKHERDGWKCLTSRRGRAGRVSATDCMSVEKLLSQLSSETTDLVHLSGHGQVHGGGFNHAMQIAGGDRLVALEALGVPWPMAVTMSACHLVRTDRVERGDQAGPLEHFGFAHACLAGGADQVIGALGLTSSGPTARMLGRVLANIDPLVPLDLPALLRTAQLEALLTADRAADWAMVAAISRSVHPAVNTTQPAQVVR